MAVGTSTSTIGVAVRVSIVAQARLGVLLAALALQALRTRTLASTPAITQVWFWSEIKKDKHVYGDGESVLC